MLVTSECVKCSGSFKYEKAGAGRLRKYCNACRRVDTRRRTTPRPKREVTCETCGQTAFTHAPNWRFCGQKCKDIFWNKTRSCPRCGTQMWKYGGAPDDQVCRDCRQKSLSACGTLAAYRRGCRCIDCRAANTAAALVYQRQRRRERPPVVRECRCCGVEFRPRSNQVLCSPECRKATLDRLGDHASRADYWGVEHEPIARLEIFERDAWICGICELPVDRDLTFPDPGYPTLDHIVPMSAGGGHVSTNVQLAHFYCNTVKGGRMEEAC